MKELTEQEATQIANKIEALKKKMEQDFEDIETEYGVHIASKSQIWMTYKDVRLGRTLIVLH